MCAKILYQVELQRTTLEQMWGFSVEAELIENAERQDELCCYVSRVEDKSVAMQNGNLSSFNVISIFSACISLKFISKIRHNISSGKSSTKSVACIMYFSDNAAASRIPLRIKVFHKFYHSFLTKYTKIYKMHIHFILLGIRVCSQQ